ncbi:class IIb bacteriocin, lactobin A/cerein 7B family [Chryseobacterium nematophagum]|uniref:Class IIb bacteriocin, lactobin A/cerein 7B family n=1 Tax=Chryseobacterium nematophagum TaxID=2305228 RepID=A0A3M7L9E3_9FLAO|nr:class IIb bacteriocin, lactobin A/cerein 7B family [Chryseobacterium nematophagum]RMZ58644.1 class IIb bacteriocin, lactobin A/cerein 7B family [Chryseobacterium nematophagum]
MQIKNLKVEELTSQEMESTEGGIWWIVGEIALGFIGGLVTSAATYAMNQIGSNTYYPTYYPGYYY